ncbi:hypothetical protein GCM10020254_26920 [Streptomyces goshikiensis]
MLAEQAEDFAYAESLQCGKPIKLSTEFDVPGTIDNTAFFAGAARHLQGQAAAEYSGDHTSYVRREAIGVVGSIAPWNYPLQMAAWKILPAIAAGNTIVLKPAEITPLTSLMFAQAAKDAGLPDGVINIVSGAGREAGEHLVGHPDVVMTSFTGSTAVGKRVAEIATATVKRLHRARRQGALPGLRRRRPGSRGTRRGRRLPHQHRPGLHRRHPRLRPAPAARRLRGPGGRADGDRPPRRPLRGHHRPRSAGLARPARPRRRLRRARPRVRHRRQRRRGPRRGTAAGAYYRPTLIAGAAQDSEVVQSEIFGPVLVVLPFDTDDEGIALANDTPYGLAASAWSRDLYRAHRATREIQAGCVWVNDHIPIISEMPHGGYKASGFGKDMSAYSFEEYTQVKHVMFDNTAVAAKDWHRTIFGDRA